MLLTPISSSENIFLWVSFTENDGITAKWRTFFYLRRSRKIHTLFSQTLYCVFVKY